MQRVNRRERHSDTENEKVVSGEGTKRRLGATIAQTTQPGSLTDKLRKRTSIENSRCELTHKHNFSQYHPVAIADVYLSYHFEDLEHSSSFMFKHQQPVLGEYS